MSANAQRGFPEPYHTVTHAASTNSQLNGPNLTVKKRSNRTWTLLSLPESGGHGNVSEDTVEEDEEDELNYDSINTSLPDFASSSTALSRSNSVNPSVSDRMRRCLRYHFMNPWEKFRAKKRFPFKMFIQIFKIFLVTIQLIVFGQNSASHVTFTDENIMTFRHLYLKNWDSSQETPAYPPSQGPFAVYTYDDFYDQLNYAADRYNDTMDLALGSYDFATPDTAEMYLCREYYRKAEIFASNQTYNFDSEVLTSCLLVEPVTKFDEESNSTIQEFDIKELLAQNNITISFDSLLNLRLYFALKSVQLKAFDYDLRPDCFRFNVTILFDNTGHDGLIPVTLSSEIVEIPCHGSVRHADNGVMRVLITCMDISVIILSIISCFSCSRSLLRGRYVFKRTKKFFRRYYNYNLEKEKWEFVNFWFVLIIINDILIIVGSVFKIQLDNKIQCAQLSSNTTYISCSYSTQSIIVIADYDACAYCLGVGSMLVWLGVLRYVSFSFKNNILILTLVHAIPNVVRFMVCAFLIFMAFVLCGWVVLGPYHLKFRSFFTTLECLFSLINGDDMYTTFASIPYEDNHILIFIFSRIYIYVFCSLLIYVVLNLFITLIIEAYEDMKKLRSNQGHPDTFLWHFILSCPDPPTSSLYRSDDHERRLRRKEFQKRRASLRQSSIQQSYQEQSLISQSVDVESSQRKQKRAQQTWTWLLQKIRTQRVSVPVAVENPILEEESTETTQVESEPPPLSTS